MEPKKKNSFDSIKMLGLGCVVAVLLNILFIFFTRGDARTIALLKNEHATVKQDELIIKSANDIATKYQDEVEVISEVFPTDETLPDFIVYLEEILRRQTTEYSLKLAAEKPFKDKDKLFLPLHISFKAEFDKYLLLLEELEDIPYMTRIDTMDTKTPDGFSGVSEYILDMRVYVQNPFTTK